MLMRRQATSPVDASSPLPSIEVSAGSSGVVGPPTQLSSSSDVVEEAEVGAALADRKVRGEMPVGAERIDTELGDAQSFVRVRAFAERQKDVRADVIGNRPVFPFVDGASAGQAANRVSEAGRAARRPRRIERLDGKLLRRARHVGEHPNDAIGLEVERAAPVGNDRKFELVGLDGNAVQPLLEQIDARRGV